MSWIQSDSGCGRLAYGAPQRPSEVSVDLPGGIVSVWPPEKVRSILSWIFAKGGHLTRIDCALDDRRKLVSLETVRKAFEAGQYVTRAKRTNSMKTHSTSTGSLEGETLYLGSPASETRLRIYDKSLQLKPKGHHDWSQFGNRWEVQLRKARAHGLGRELVLWPQHEWRRLVIGVLRGFIDFRDVTRGAPKWQRSRAKVLPWWELLTEGFKRAELAVETPREWGLQTLDEGSIRLQRVFPCWLICQVAGKSWNLRLSEGDCAERKNISRSFDDMELYMMKKRHFHTWQCPRPKT